LIETFLSGFAQDGNFGQKTMTPEAIAHLKAYPWPGNVRELKNLVERLAIMIQSDVIGEDDIPLSYRRQKATTSDMGFFHEDSLKEAKKEFEKAYIQQKLNENNNNISQTADAIGIERSHLYKKIKSFGFRL
jgi:two-component system nitrogen regulation response regulator NtrX